MRKRTCPKCGAEVFASDDRCMDCGTDLVQRTDEEPRPWAEILGAMAEDEKAAREEADEERRAWEAAAEADTGWWACPWPERCDRRRRLRVRPAAG